MDFSFIETLAVLLIFSFIMETSLFLSVIPSEMMLCIFQKLEKSCDMTNAALTCSVFYNVIQSNKERLTILAPFERVFHKYAPKDVQALHGVPRKRDRAVGYCSMFLNRKFHGKTWAMYGYRQKFLCTFSNNVLEGPYEYTEDCQGVREKTSGAFSKGKRTGLWNCGMSHEYGQTCAMVYKDGKVVMYQSPNYIRVCEETGTTEYVSDLENVEIFQCPNSGAKHPVFRKKSEMRSHPNKVYSHCCKEHQREMPKFLL